GHEKLAVQLGAGCPANNADSCFARRYFSIGAATANECLRPGMNVTCGSINAVINIKGADLSAAERVTDAVGLLRAVRLHCCVSTTPGILISVAGLLVRRVRLEWRLGPLAVLTRDPAPNKPAGPLGQRGKRGR